MTGVDLTQAPLGKATEYKAQYDASLLVAIPRSLNRSQLVLGEQHAADRQLPFFGFDVWNAFELSWLNNKNKPQVALAEFVFACESENLIESKSFKLYLNSFNNTQFDNSDAVAQCMQQDLSEACGAPVTVNVIPVDRAVALTQFSSICLDDLDVAGEFDQVHPEFLTTEDQQIDETVHSHLLKSNCLVTGQPDWASVEIHYRGNKINHANLLRYLISFRNHNEFHEHCVERIFVDIHQHCQPEELTVYARYTRRGGLDINPIRSSKKIDVPSNVRLSRQ